MIKSVAKIAVTLVKKLPADLDETKLSCDAPNPKAPPSDFCNNINETKIRARMMLMINSKFSMVFKYMFF